MKSRRVVPTFIRVVLLSLALLTAFVVSPTAVSAKPGWTKNCTNLNKRFPHGVGLVNARDKTSGKGVTTFRRSNRLYRTAMRHNKGLDRDRDGIACEKS